ncbi:hypothetical protein HRE53_32800 (plasmid) [Acaryochloris sp. 'Moss Beach']|uniref:hypothetical protein n=1 Tax=Acaryochloris sp. 'Moss Beach' TaxID=2740837 RepID=UPI001F25FDA7|nr:hypothetical protein [Acaryochloris sp. 'Moss Beach']UJB73414.1 hypothetical protein HRE53_32800 [Acaryochloris sp. 'Moss Beach']
MKQLTDRLGLIELLGIISPGVFVLISLILSIFGFINVFQVDINTIKSFNSILENWMFLISIIFIFTSYLFGSIIRVFANDFAEVLSGLYLTHIKRKENPLAIERFPYPFAGKSFKHSNPEIFKWYKKEVQLFC